MHSWSAGLVFLTSWKFQGAAADSAARTVTVAANASDAQSVTMTRRSDIT
jgi:hypothetical protein